jgi:hypothetical protein
MGRVQVQQGRLMRFTVLTVIVMAGVPISAMGQHAGPAPLSARQAPIVPLKNPPGDIADTQTFVEYHSSLGFSLKAPEGWSRREQPGGVAFTDKYGSVTVDVTDASSAPTVATAKQAQAATLEALPNAVAVSKVVMASLPGGPATLIAYASNSAPNAVTGKAIRLENDQYLFWRNGKLATVTLSAPFGADNVDQWQLIAKSFRWN